MLAPLLVDIGDEFEVSVAVAGQLGTATFAAWGVSVVFSGPLSDSFGRRPIALAGLSLAMAATTACFFAPNLPVLLLLRVLAGLGGGTVPVNTNAAVADAVSPERRGQAAGGLMAVNVLSAAVSVPLLALLTEWSGWRYAFVASGLLLAVAFVLNLAWFPVDNRERVRDFAIVSRYRALLSLGFFRTAVFVMAAHRMAYWAIVSYFAAFLIQTHGLSVGATAAPLAIAATGQIIGSFSAGVVTRKKYRIILVAALMTVGGLGGLVFFSLPVEYWMAVGVATIGSGLISVAAPTLIAASTEYSGRSRATGIGLMGLGNQMGGAGGAAMAGALLASVGFVGVGYMCLAVTTLAALVALVFMRQAPGRVGLGE